MSQEQEISTYDKKPFDSSPSRTRQVTRDSLIQQHTLDTSDPAVCTLLDEIELLKETALIPDFIPIIADKKIGSFKTSQQNGTSPQELQKP